MIALSLRHFVCTVFSRVPTCSQTHHIWKRALLASIVLILLPLNRLLFLFYSGVFLLGYTPSSPTLYSPLPLPLVILNKEPKPSSAPPFPYHANDDDKAGSVFFPQLHVVLGGDAEREVAGVKYFLTHRHLFSPEARVLVSSGALSAESILANCSIPAHALLVDETAVDTLSNFTTLIPLLRKSDVRYVSVATSSYHYARAMAIAFIVLGSSDIHFTGVSLEHALSPQSSGSVYRESVSRIARDICRACLWMITGIDFHTAIRWYRTTLSTTLFLRAS